MKNNKKIDQKLLDNWKKHVDNAVIKGNPSDYYEFSKEKFLILESSVIYVTIL
jgi:hypothetical protein